MRNPVHKAFIWLALGVLGGVLIWLAAQESARIGETLNLILGIAGMCLAVVSPWFLLDALLASVGSARLLAGRDIIARWHVSASEWGRFRAFDAVRAAQHPSLVNDLSIRKETPARGVDVIVGRRQLVIDGSYHRLRRGGIPALSAVYWLPPPADPECLEFAVAYPRGRYGGTVRFSLRVPVPAAGQEAGRRVFEHYRAILPEPNSGIAYRKPWLVIRGGLVVTILAAGAAGAGFVLRYGGNEAELPLGLIIGGCATALGALLFTLIIALVTRPWTK